MPYGTFGQQQGKAGVVDKKVVTLTEDELLSKFKLFEDTVVLSQDERESLPPIPHTPLPIQIVDSMAITDIHMLFITFRLTEGYVTHYGSLVGLINRDILKQAINNFSNTPKNALKKLCKFYC